MKIQISVAAFCFWMIGAMLLGVAATYRVMEVMQ